MGNTVNKHFDSTPALVMEVAEQLASNLKQIPWLKDAEVKSEFDADTGYDAIVHFKLPKKPEIQFLVEVEAHPRPSRFPHVGIDREFSQKAVKLIRVPVFAAPHISLRMAEVCESHGWSWMDLAGNYRISVPDFLHLQHTGNKSTHVIPKPKANLKTKEAGRVIRALLSYYSLGHHWTQRSMQMYCEPDVSLGLVNKVINYLLDEAFLKPNPTGGFQLADPLKLLIAWRDVYQFDQHGRIGYFSLLQGNQLKKELETVGLLSGGLVVNAAFSAADYQAPHVRQQKTWLFIWPSELHHFVERTKAKPVDTGENIVVLIPNDKGVFFQQDGGTTDEDHMACTNLVQTYVDLWHCGGRGQEAAEALLEQKLKPLWKQFGYPV